MHLQNWKHFIIKYINQMYAIVDIAGQQFKVEKGQEVFVHRLEGEIGTGIEFDKVLLLDDKGKARSFCAS